jgi:hypothetical protein
MNAVTPRCTTRVARCFALFGLLVCAHASGWAADLSGFWIIDLKRSEVDIDQSALTETARARVREFNPARHDPTTVCMPYGMPRVMTALGAHPMEIVQTATQVTMIFDAHDEVRRVMLTKKTPANDELAPLWLGYASGKWQGEALVVETIGITDQSLVSDKGVPHSGQLRVVERISRVDPDTLLNEMTLHDSQAFAKPLTRRLFFMRVPELQQREFYCAEQMWLDHVMSRAKELTRELAEKKQ